MFDDGTVNTHSPSKQKLSVEYRDSGIMQKTFQNYAQHSREPSAAFLQIMHLIYRVIHYSTLLVHKQIIFKLIQIFNSTCTTFLGPNRYAVSSVTDYT